MKIGIVHPSFDIIGGAEQTTLSIINALKNTEHQITLYTTTKNVNVSSKCKIFHVNRNSFPIGWSLQRILENKKIFKNAKNEDLLFISSGNLILTDSEKPIVIFCHSTFESELMHSKRKINSIKIYNNYIKKEITLQLEFLKRKSVKLIANSNFTKEKIKHALEKDSIVIFPPVKMKFKNVSNIRKEGIITIARYSQEKNLEFNLNVAKGSDVPYNIFGNTKFSSQIDYYNSLLEKTKNTNQIKLFCNSTKKTIENCLISSKIYFQSSKETFGISVVEGISAGCIPIVPNNTANKETVPIDDLRFKENDENDAKRKIEKALRGDFDKYLPKLQEHIKTFSEEKFQKSIIKYLSNF